MKKHTAVLFVFLLIAGLASAQKKIAQAGTLFPVADINKLFGCNVIAGANMGNAPYCYNKSADGSTKVNINYTDFGSAATAESMLKMNADMNSKTISSGKKAIAVYNSYKPLPAGGASAYYMTGPGDTYGGTNLVRFQFVLGQYLITLDTQGIELNSVTSKLAEAYTIMKTNSGL